MRAHGGCIVLDTAAVPRSRACAHSNGLRYAGRGVLAAFGITGNMERRTSAILAADVVGFSELMRRDEEATLEVLQELFAVMRQRIEERHGRVFGGSGDSLLAEFPSPVQAVRCAVEIQRTIRQRNAGTPENRQMYVRVGMNMGEVIVSGNDLQGNSINLAVRIEGLADPGGITLSESIYRNVKDQFNATFEDMGQHRVRGFSDPVRTYRIGFADPAAQESPTSQEPTLGRRSRKRNVSAGSSAVAARREGSVKPVIVVLRFSNLSGDPEQEYFCQGLTNDVATELSKFSSFSVVSSITAVAHGEKPVRAQDARRELGARYVLEGSVQKTAGRLRINVQLIEASIHRHVWAKRFDRDAADVLSLQDEIVENIVAALALKVEAEERARAMRKATVNVNAYDAFLKGSYLWLLHAYMDETKKTLLSARKWFEEATSLDPNYGRAWAWLSLTYTQEWLRSWSGRSALDHAGRLAKKALVIDPADYNVHWILAYYYLNARQFELAFSEYQMALSLNPNDANLLAELGEAFVYVGQHEKGLDLIRQAMRMNRHLSDWYRVNVAWVNYLAAEYEAAVGEIAQLAIANADALLILAASQAQIANRHETGGRTEAAAAAIELASAALRQTGTGRPRWTVAKERQKSPFKRVEDLDHWLNGLRKAGLPE